MVEGRAIQVAITGPLSSGKTTLFDALSKIYLRATYVDEIATRVRMAAADFDWSTPIGRGYLRWAQVFAEQDAASSDLSILDGSLSDVAAYDEAYALGLAAVPLRRRYDLTLYCDHAGVPIVDNSIRDTSEALRACVAPLMLAQARERSEHVVILTGDKDARTREARDAIDRLIKWKKN